MGKLKQIAVLGIIGMAALLMGCSAFHKADEKVSYSVFKEQADFEEKEAVIGTNIRLHQEIHGKETITYRYKLETDCPYWHYEDRYLSEEPLKWVGEDSAVETIAKAVNISWEGENLMTGQHFYVPLLDLYQDDMEYEEYVEQAFKSAYQQYKSNSKNPNISTLMTVVICISIITFGAVFKYYRKMSKKSLTPKTDGNVIQ